MSHKGERNALIKQATLCKKKKIQNSFFFFYLIFYLILIKKIKNKIK